MKTYSVVLTESRKVISVFMAKDIVSAVDKALINYQLAGYKGELYFVREEA